MFSKLLFFLSVIFLNSFTFFSQESELKVSLFEGAVLAGYVDNGAFLNFTGPNISFSKKSSKILIGMLPSMRFKEDNSIPKNSFVTPSLGIGITYIYKFVAFQLPVYYTSKTNASNGMWKLGFGMGVRINTFKKKEKRL
jgi:hypothetical protein